MKTMLPVPVFWMAAEPGPGAHDRARAVYRDPVTVVELLDFQISAELLHIYR